jgi:uncharacterized membrane protein YgdD (TMEM256/DUF423 family)
MRLLVMLGSLNAFLAVALGAFGAHFLRARISPDLLAVYQTGVLYHLTHALALLFAALFVERTPSSSMARWAGGLFAAGIVLFSGSLYLLAVTGIRIFGAVTPFGGVCFLTGWALLFWTALRHRP